MDNKTNIINRIKVRIQKLTNRKDHQEDTNKVLVSTEKYSIFQDETKRIRIEFQEEDYAKISKIHKIILDINNMPIDDKDREYYAMDIANIYQIAYKEEGLAKEYAINLKEIIEKNLLIKRKLEFIKPCIKGFGVIIIIIMLLINIMKCDLYILEPMLYGSLGGIVAVIINNKKFNIDYSVRTEYIKFEVIKLIILSNIMAIIGGIAIDSKLVLSNINFNDNEYMMYLLYIICGFSQSFVPSILRNFEKSNLQE